MKTKKSTAKILEARLNAARMSLNEMQDQENDAVAISFQHGMWKVFSLLTGRSLFGAGKFITVFDEARKRFPGSPIYATVDGQDTLIYQP